MNTDIFLKILEISPESDDARSIVKFRVPGAHSHNAGDFAERCYQIIKKREVKSEVGNLTIDEVNDLLETLSKHSKADEQLPIFRQFYENMNSEEMKWLIRIILRGLSSVMIRIFCGLLTEVIDLHVGVSERSLFAIWHPDAVPLYSISNSLKRVCWELSDPNHRLSKDVRLQCL